MSSSMMVFTFCECDSNRTEFRSKSLGKAVIKAIGLGCGELYGPDGTTVIIEKYGEYGKSIRALTTLSNEDIEDINSNTWARDYFVRGLLVSGKISYVSYGDKREHDRMAHFTIDSDGARYIFDIPCGCRQFKNSTIEELLRYHPQNLERVIA